MSGFDGCRFFVVIANWTSNLSRYPTLKNNAKHEKTVLFVLRIMIEFFLYYLFSIIQSKCQKIEHVVIDMFL